MTSPADQAFLDLQTDLIECRKCPRLVSWRESVAAQKRAAFRDQDYWGRPVPMFGGRSSRLLIVGLAPAAHGANRTGRMFTGDRSGDWLFRALHRAGFASQPTATMVSDGLEMVGASISAIVRCAPPDNKPTTEERQNCRSWLDHELELMDLVEVVVALGGMAFDQMLRIGRDRGWTVSRPRPRFAHGAEVDFGDFAPTLIASYHPSQQNTFTGRLTESMLDDVFARVSELVR